MILLKQERERKGLTQRQLSRMCGVTQQTISNIESGRNKNPGVETLGELAAALGIRLQDLYKPDNAVEVATE